MAKKARKKKKGVAKRRQSGVKKKGRVQRKRAVKGKPVVRKPKTGKVRPQVKAVKPSPELPAEPIGKVTHYFPKARATALLIERDGIRLGDVLYFKGHTTAFKQKVESLQINHQPVSEASTGQEVGIQVKSRTRGHDLVFKL